MFLVLVFLFSAGILFCLEVEFLALSFIIVYVGAIAVLFLFVVMMLNIKLTEVHESIFHYLPIGGFVGFFFFLEFYFLFNQEIVPLHLDNFSQQNDSFLVFQFYLFAILAFLKYGFTTPNFSEKFQLYSDSFFEKLANIDKFSSNHIDYVIWPTLIDSKTPVEALGQVLYTYYSYFFIVASLILLISMIGAIMLTLNPNRAVKRQQVFEQNARDFAQTVKKIHTFK
jgi:NADH-ubiquinone oxidoreductase chain 6